MARAKRQIIAVNDNDSLRNVLQEVYNNVCNQINDAQKVINEVTAAASPEDVDEWVKVAKAKTDALKLKDSAIKTKLDIGKLQSDIIKHSGDVVTAITNNSEIVSKDSFARVREMVEESKQSREVK
jgi:phosphoribosyl-dephospho-CoA transferase